MYHFEVIGTDSAKWNNFLKLSYIYDFHHTAFYHQIDNNYNALLFTAEDNENFIALPLVIRPIDGTEWFDATSVYGYCGPISNKRDFDFSPDFLHFFRSNFIAYCKANNIVSIFSRLHPLINQEELFSGLGQVIPLNKTVAIDLRLTPEEQRKQYRKSNKSEINQLRKKGFTVEDSTSFEHIERFIEIYYETMDRVQASAYYYFDKAYFHSFLNNPYFGNKLLSVKYEGQIIASAIFTITDKIMQYHLAGTVEAFIRLTPMKLILDEARLLGNELGLEFLHLGGGVGGSDDDSLFRFKSGFSDLFHQFSVWKYILDEEKYDYLVKERGLSQSGSAFFPLYRMA